MIKIGTQLPKNQLNNRHDVKRNKTSDGCGFQIKETDKHHHHHHNHHLQNTYLGPNSALPLHQ